MVGVATGGATFTVASIARAALAVGVTTVSTRAATLGDHYTVDQAMRDFLTASAGTAVGVGVFRGAPALRNLVR